ncbi:ABC transporter ATP-binding protein [Methylobacterium sp. E-065]|uniref:ABC transporter ATP-binding protein n=1 Tax=Methylobacterium sp. E-065 TaxID=2836583 RepID=UPI001FB98C25|nr:ABC transporter ATP-binding protein [Methylobacterium sp. E-065]MCJ2017069.1 ABC transporter ATP-binding protein [Methylobacterium sp. E-065]
MTVPSAVGLARPHERAAAAISAPAGKALELQGLTKIYGSETVVDRFDTRIQAGEFFSLLGPSGSGKTTTLMMVAGFASIDAGRLLVEGVDLAAVPPERRGFGMVFQNYAIFPHMDVFENVAFPLRARGMPKALVRERVASALDLVQLKHLSDRYARQLSGGQQQRVAIARAIVFQPPVVLMDEPLGALDKNLRYDLQVEIKEIQRRLGMTVLYVTHDQEEAMNLSDRVAIMSRGRVEQIGAPRAVYERPVNAFTARFLGEANLLPGRIVTPGSGRVAFQLRDGTVLHADEASTRAAEAEGQLFVRPEKLTLHPLADPPRDGVNRLSGTVRRASFLGSVVRYAVETGSGTLVTADAPNVAAHHHPEPGARVALAWSPADTVILPPDAA